MPEPTPEQHYLSCLTRLADLMKIVSTGLRDAPEAIVKAGQTLPRQGDSAEQLMAWRTNVEQLHLVALAAEALKSEAVLTCNVIVGHVREAGLAEVLFPQNPTGTN